MGNSLASKIGRGQLALGLPLAGLVFFWFFTLFGQVANLYLQYGANYNNWSAQRNDFQLATYLFLIGAAGLGIASVTARRMAHDLHTTRLERAIRGFSLVAVFVALIICTVFGIGIFMSNFNNNFYNYGTTKTQPVNELMRVVNVYVPILLDAALMVFVILRAFVGKVTTESADGAEPTKENANG
jgi:hypothetical protein